MEGTEAQGARAGHLAQRLREEEERREDRTREEDEGERKT
jgi:hypothetical protein